MAGSYWAGEVVAVGDTELWQRAGGCCCGGWSSSSSTAGPCCLQAASLPAPGRSCSLQRTAPALRLCELCVSCAAKPCSWAVSCKQGADPCRVQGKESALGICWVGVRSCVEGAGLQGAAGQGWSRAAAGERFSEQGLEMCLTGRVKRC